MARSRSSSLRIAYLKAALGALHSARVGTPCPRGSPKNIGQLVAHDKTVLGFCFSSPVRRRVAQAGQGISARTDETTSHSTKLANNASQVAGYV
jgi:hypothetical protein